MDMRLCTGRWGGLLAVALWMWGVVSFPALAQMDWESNFSQGMHAYQEQHFAEAEPFLQAALAQAEKLGPEDARLRETLKSLAQLYVAEEKYAEAEPLYRRALALAEKSLGPEHPGLASLRDRLAET